MTEIKPGILYSIRTTDEKEVMLNFCHKDDGKFIHGVTDEELIEVLISRYQRHTVREESRENYQIISLLNTIRYAMKNRRTRKSKASENGQH